MKAFTLAHMSRGQRNKHKSTIRKRGIPQIRFTDRTSFLVSNAATKQANLEKRQLKREQWLLRTKKI